MTDRDDACDDDDHDGDVPRRDLGEVPVDEPVSPTTEFRTVQDREAAFDTGTVSSGEGGGCPDDRVSEELDELAEPTTEFRTIQEREAAGGVDREESDGGE